MTDAIGFVQAGDFVSFMSGNTTRLAIAIGTGNADDAWRLAAILAVFVCGNALGVIVIRVAGHRQWPLLLAVAVFVGESALATGPTATVLAFLPLVLAMGLLNSAVESVGGYPLGLTFVTGALSRFGKGIGRYLGGARDPGFLIQWVPWLGMLAGAVCGTLLLVRYGQVSLWAACLLAATLTLVSFTVPRRWLHDSFGLPRVD